MNPPRFQTLSEAELAQVTARQQAQQASWRNVPAEGAVVDCCGEAFLVLPGVFPPRGDTRLVAERIDLRPGASVLDMGTGSGVLAIFAARRGAGRVLAVDISPTAVRNAALNAERHGLSGRIEGRLSDGFAAVAPTEHFDLIIANLPGRNREASDIVGAAQWDTGFAAHKAFFAAAPGHLAPQGSITMAKANYPELNDAVALAAAAGLDVTVLAEERMPGEDPRTYYVLRFSPARRL